MLFNCRCSTDYYYRCAPTNPLRPCVRLSPLPSCFFFFFFFFCVVPVCRNPILWSSLFSRNLLPGVVNIHRSTRELLSRILEGQPVPDLDRGAVPVLVSAFDPTR